MSRVYSIEIFEKARLNSPELREVEKIRIRTVAKLCTSRQHILAILNRLVENNYREVIRDLLDIDYSFELVEYLVGLIFEKAIQEPMFSTVFVQVCISLNAYLKMPERKDGKKATFSSILLCKCQQYFKSGIVASDDAEQAMKNKKRYLGLMIFIAELYKNGVLPTSVLVKCCILGLLDWTKKGDFDYIEPLHVLLTNAGSQLDEFLHAQKLKQKQLKDSVNGCYRDLRTMMSNAAIGRRNQFFIQDILELRQGWIPEEDKEEEGSSGSSGNVVFVSMKLTLAPKKETRKEVTAETVGRLICTSVEEFLHSGDRSEAFQCFDQDVMITPYAHVLMPQVLKYAIDNNLSMSDTEKVASLLCEYPKFKSSDHKSHASAMKELVDVLENVEDATDAVIAIFSLFMSRVLECLNCCMGTMFMQCLLELKERGPFCSSKEKKKYGVSALYFASTVNMAKKHNLKEAKAIVSKTKAKDYAVLFNNEKQRKELSRMYGISDLM